MRIRHTLRAVLLLVLLFALTLEAALWWRTIGTDWLQESYPYVGVDREDSPVYWRQRFRPEGQGWVGRLIFLDEERKMIREVEYSKFDGRMKSVFPQVTASPRLANRGAPWVRFDLPDFVAESTRSRSRWRGARSWSDRLLLSLNAVHLARRQTAFRWTFEGGRFVCRAKSDGAAVAVVGADGSAEGARPFGRMLYVAGLPQGEEDGRQGVVRHLLFDDEGFALIECTIVIEGDIDAHRLLLDRRPLRELDSLDGVQGHRGGVIETETERLLVDETGRILARAERADDESSAVVSPGVGSADGDMRLRWAEQSEPVPFDQVAAAVLILPRPVDPLVVRLRFQLLRAGQPGKVVETRLEPVTTWERFLAGIALAPEFARPLPLCLASMAAEPPDTWEECNVWWLRTPSLAGGSRLSLLALIALVSAAAAWVAYRWGRVRCATVRQARLWAVAVFLVGPLGLLWMRLVLPRVRVESVGGARRATNLDASPSTEAPWPAPVSTGVEVVGV